MARSFPTIRDVARQAGVSTATVSRALSEPDKVLPATRDKVNAAIAATGYAVNRAARALRGRHTRTILVAVPNIGNTFFGAILDAIERTARTHGYDVLVANRLADTPSPDWLPGYFTSRRIDGLISLDGRLDLTPVERLFEREDALPVVRACEDVGDPRLALVKSDNAGGARQATEHLLGLGHTRIAHLAAPRDNVFFRERRDGYLAALADAGLRPLPGHELAGDFSFAAGMAAAEALMRLNAPPTAVFAANDEMAIGLISGLRQLGVNCPEQVSVVGFDDIPVAPHTWPPLTTVRQQREAIGHHAAEALIGILEASDEYAAPSTILPTQLVVRASTGPAAADD